MTDLLGDAGRARGLDQAAALDTVKFGHSMWVRNLDPRIRIVVVLAFAICVVQLSAVLPLVISLCLGLYMLMQARLPLGASIKRVLTVDSFIIFLLVMLPFTTPGREVFSVLGFPASYEGIMQAVVILLRANAIVMMSLALLATIDAVTFGHALAKLKVPEKLVYLLLFTVRYIEVLHAEYLRLRTAMRCRVFQPKNNMHTYKSVGYLVGMLLIRSFERSERILMAMKCRGFNGQFHLLKEFNYTKRDLAFSVIAFLFMVLLLALEMSYAVAA
nr:cobalt ECF transporter T component CbiQ [uncultured Cohaesibacter sp.]